MDEFAIRVTNVGQDERGGFVEFEATNPFLGDRWPSRVRVGDEVLLQQWRDQVTITHVRV